jgi:hypothetical protein
MTARMVNAIVATIPKKNVGLAFGAMCPLLAIIVMPNFEG